MAEPLPIPTDQEQLGGELYRLIERLYPICRSITGDGVRETLAILSEHVPLALHEVPSGTKVLDWTVPNEWNIRDAWIKNERGERVVDFRACNLHVVSYSTPVRATMTLDQLRPHLHSLPDRPDWIPYRTSYYEEAWGFCLTHRALSALTPGNYEVCIDSTLQPGALTYGELVLPGETDDEILISAHVCHPSLCDDNLSGLSVATMLARAFSQLKRRYTLRFLFAPGTIGAITWLHQNRTRAYKIKHGFTVTCLGDANKLTYKRTVFGHTRVDLAAQHVLATSGLEHDIIDFFPYGYDERQYNSPGFRLAVGSLMRGRHGMFPEYHTSGDNLQFVSPERLIESFRVCQGIIAALDGDRRYQNLEPWGEPQLGTRGLYRALGGTSIPNLQMAMLWVLNLSDGDHGLLDIARRSKLDFSAIRAAADLLVAHALLREVPANE